MVDLARRNFFNVTKENSKPAIRLPYVINEKVFTDNCTQCEECINVCPEKIIVKGDGGFPEIDFSKGECTFCDKCVDACKEALFTQVEDEKPWDLAIEIKANCLAKNQVYCLSCQDNCETEAISFTYISESTPQPQISLDSCTGCGACVAVCPQTAIELSPKNEFLNLTGEAYERS
ncbi:ferredoxin-type protein NapF [Pseudocolwellia agarivorans]|uniref:ferredoxin-type protein NapF n=1 Tax=Pseudocolwellia agarivorans TaxID=1911682 RepID=UPI000986C970|nr:ferredoxin-type protein NapF [Pseudocolwellia agarivorans]